MEYFEKYSFLSIENIMKELEVNIFVNQILKNLFLEIETYGILKQNVKY